ncbi:type III secretion system translocon subunit SctB [Pseudothauera rhizosphaerae]|uniref:Uncharacterized protein n=1 Tax=Pseudothauera rhizosphaerae TaxID=2565932 RepID=A0A4S4AE25_9RHOO|nr:type III secretion system translocon subunit SctB [Pseudothauera rhizosphaerae]THF57277.1 hypothetical protein E6O51_18445 [Pseudothauera rhizosphaerae]
MVDGVNNQSSLNFNILRQGGDAALEEIRSKLFSDIADPALAQKLAQRTLAELEASGVLKLDPPKGGFGSGDVSGLGGSLSGAGDNLSTDMQAVMLLFAKMAQSMREVSRNQRQAELGAQVEAMGDAAQKIRDAAEKRFAAAMVQGACQIGSGVASIGGAAGGMIKGGDAAMISARTQIGSGTGNIISGIGTMASGSLERDAGLIDAEKAELDKLATTHEKARESDNDMMQNMQDIIRDIKDKLAAIAQSQIETNRGIARNI